MKQTADVKNDRFPEQFQMGSGFYVSKHVGLLQKRQNPPAESLLSSIKVKGTA